MTDQPPLWLETEDCPRCHGSGKVRKPCPKCKGSGYEPTYQEHRHGDKVTGVSGGLTRCSNGCPALTTSLAANFALDGGR